MAELLAETDLVSAEALLEEAERPLPSGGEPFAEEMVVEAVGVLANWNENRKAKMEAAKRRGFPPSGKGARREPPRAAKTFDLQKVERRVRCWNCGKLGHLSLRCPDPQKPRPTTKGSAGSSGPGRQKGGKNFYVGFHAGLPAELCNPPVEPPDVISEPAATPSAWSLGTWATVHDAATKPLYVRLREALLAASPWTPGAPWAATLLEGAVLMVTADGSCVPDTSPVGGYPECLVNVPKNEECPQYMHCAGDDPKAMYQCVPDYKWPTAEMTNVA